MEVIGLALVAIALFWSYKPPVWTIHHKNETIINKEHMLSVEELKQDIKEEEELTLAQALQQAMHDLGGDNGK